MAADLVGPGPRCHNVTRHLQIVLAIRHHYEVVSVQLVGETMMGQEAARCQLPNVGSQGVEEMHQLELEIECHEGNGTRDATSALSPPTS